MSNRIHQYWSTIFGLTLEEIQHPGIRVVPHARPWEDSFAYVFLHDQTCVISVRATLVESVRRKTTDLPVDAALTCTGIHRIFDQPINRIIGPAFQAYVEVDDFCPYPSPQVRTLLDEDEEWLQCLTQACDPKEWEHSGIKETSSPLFGYFIDNQLVATSHYSMWAAYAASIGIITHPAHRDHGYGRATVSAAMQHALDQGHMVIYQTLLANTPSVALAKHLGCKLYAHTVAIHFEEITA